VKIYRLTIVIFLSMALFVACRPNQETIVSEPIATKSIIPTATVTNESISFTPTPLATVTQRPNNCLADDKLPNPDIPESYIGWKPGFDFAEQYNDENKDGNYQYWEYDKENLRLAGYKRSDNSFLFFLEKFLCRDNKRSRVFEVADAVRTRPLTEDEAIAPLNYVCYLLGTDGVTVEEEVVAILNTTSLKAVEAWSVKIEQMDIQEITLERIRCASEGIVPPK
jgi:hypothetical protein